MRRCPRFSIRPAASAVALLAGLLVGAPSIAQAGDPERAVQPSAARQMAAVLAQKAARSPAADKLSSDLVVALAGQQRAAWLDALPALDMHLEVAADGRVALDLHGTITDALLARVADLGGRVENAHPRFAAARIHLPLDAVLALAAEPAVRSLRSADRMVTQMINVTEGDVAHTADIARANFSVDGTGITTCAMSDSVDALATLQGSGDLPAGVFVLPGQSGNPGTSEGTALLEIIHDLAPGSDLGFATGAGGQAQMAQNILDLAAAGCDVIVDDVLYLGELVFQDGIIAQAVETVVASGVPYFTSAGNSGNLASGTSGVFEGVYAGAALPAVLAGNGESAHDFGGGTVGNEITFDPPAFITLQWADPAGQAANDFDLFVLDDALANVVAFSTGVQDGDDLPLEAIDSSGRDDLGNQVVIVKFGGDDVFLHLNTHRGQLDVGTDGQIFGHPAAEGAITVGAVNVASAGGGAFTGGAANPSEPFTSDGPRTIFFNANSTPVSPIAAPLGTIENPKYTVQVDGPAPMPQRTRQKPDVAAADGVSTATPGFDPFFGTSAAAPHSAAIASLLKQLAPSLDPFDLENLMKSSALDIDDPGFDNLSGSGIVMTNPSAEATIFADGFESGNTSAWTK